MYQMFAETGSASLLALVDLLGPWTVTGLIGGNVNLGATFAGVPQRCGLT